MSNVSCKLFTKPPRHDIKKQGGGFYNLAHTAPLLGGFVRLIVYIAGAVQRGRGGYRSWVAPLWMSLLMGLLAGCGQKPPGCADPEVQATMRTLVIGQRPDAAANPDALAQTIWNETKVTLSEIVSEGFKAEAKKQSCEAKLAIELPDGSNVSRPIRYTTQLTVDGKGEFLLQVEELQPVQGYVQTKMGLILSNRRWSGAWHGQFICSASARPENPGAEAYTESVVATMEEGNIRVQLSGRDRVTLLTGTIGDIDPEFALDSFDREGQPRDIRVNLRGKPQGADLVAEGDITDMPSDRPGLRLRECQLRLSRGEGKASVSQAATGLATWPGTYAGEGDGDVTLEVAAARPDGKYPVSLSTSNARTGGLCSGAIEGLGVASDTELRIKVDVEGLNCEAVARRKGAQFEIEEGPGCNAFHGAACGFEASLQRKK